MVSDKGKSGAPGSTVEIKEGTRDSNDVGEGTIITVLRNDITY